MGTKLFVGNLAYSTTEDSVRDLFAADGRQVRSVQLISDRYTGRPRGFGFVEMDSESDAKAAVEALDGAELDGRNLAVNEARERTSGGGDFGSRPSFRSGGGGGGGRSGGGGGGGRGGFGGGSGKGSRRGQRSSGRDEW
jgi:cold-inducible RNA-binding protein